MIKLKHVPSICSSISVTMCESPLCETLSSGDERFMMNEKYAQAYDLPDDCSLSSIEEQFTAAEDYAGNKSSLSSYSVV